MTPCIEWAGAKNKQGYGKYTLNRKPALAHRKAYCDHHALPLSAIDGQAVRHTCDNRPCVNPAHLILGSWGDNNKDRAERGRNAKAKPTRRTLTADDISYIREVHTAGHKEFGGAALARKFGVASSTMSFIVNRKTYFA